MYSDKTVISLLKEIWVAEANIGIKFLTESN